MLEPNPGKKLAISLPEGIFARYPIKAPLVKPDDNLKSVLEKTALPFLQKEDILFISEKVVATTQGRAYKISEIKPSSVAKFLSRFVYRNPGGIGLAMPETMQLALEEAGYARILLAAALAALTKPFGIRGVFYLVAGPKARAIDGPVPYAIPPYNEYASKGPRQPKKVCQEIQEFFLKKLGFPIGVTIIDANDLGINILGKTKGLKTKFLIAALKDNPLGQSAESTPWGILRRIK